MTGIAGADAIRGVAQALSADTLVIDEQTIQLHGVAAPEPIQSCQSTTRDWACRRSARDAVAKHLNSHPIHCKNITKETNRTHPSATCYIGNQSDSLNQWIVANGWALATVNGGLTRYERQARAALRGIWQNDFEPALRWRLLAESGFESLLSGESGCDVCSVRHSRVKNKKKTNAD